MKKKLITLMLAATMVLGSSLTVCAEDATLSGSSTVGQEITGSSTITLPTIKVTVPTTADIVINPYQMAYDNNGVTGNSQIISVEQTITNESNVAIAVNVEELQAKEVSEGITIATKAITEKDTAKSAFLYLEVIKEDATFATEYTKADSQVIIPLPDTRVKAAAKEAIVTLEAGDTTATKAKFKIGGNVVVNPVTVSNGTSVAAPWADTDKIGISFKFTFEPQKVVASSSTTN